MIPLWLKVTYTLFVSVRVPVYWDLVDTVRSIFCGLYPRPKTSSRPFPKENTHVTQLSPAQ